MTDRILIIGAGFIGSVVAPHLQRAGFGVDTMDMGRPCRIPADCRVINVEDVLDYAAVIWLAGHSSVKMCREDPLGAVDNNVVGLARLAGLMADAGTGARLIYASSVSIHARGPSRTVYDATKRAAEEMVPVLYDHSVGLRFGTVCGVSPCQRWDLMIPAMVRSAVEQGVVRVSNGSAGRPILGIRDLCRAIEAVVRFEGEVEAAYDLTSFDAYISQIGAKVAAFCGVPLIEEPGTGTYNIYAPSGPFTQTFGWEAAESVESIAAEVKRSLVKETV